jgi:hypothetical protein
MKSMMLTYRAAEILARSGEQSWPRHHHRYADDVTAKLKPGFCPSLSSTFADHLHSGAGAPETTTVKARLDLIRRGPMASNFKSEHADAVTYALKAIQAAARQLAFLDVTFPVVLDALVEAHAGTMTFDKLETSHSLYQSSLELGSGNLDTCRLPGTNRLCWLRYELPGDFSKGRL